MPKSAFEATFSDFRIVKGRKVGQLIFELPLEAVDAALETLGGVPRPDKEAWVGIARIDMKAVSEPPLAIDAPTKERRSWSSFSLAQQIAIRCGEPAFWQFLNELCEQKDGIKSSEGAASFVRVHCGVKSRADITHGSLAGNDWMNLSDKFEAWLRRPTF